MLAVGLAAVYYLLTQTGIIRTTNDLGNRYNVVLIVSDALRQDALACYGGEAATPNIDALARSGVMFENAYATSPWTTPSCVSMFTGNFATSYGYSDPSEAAADSMMRVYVPHNELLLMEVLEQSDYTTTTFVENGNAAIHNNLQGLDHLDLSGKLRHILPAYLRSQIKDITGMPVRRSKAYLRTYTALKHLLHVEQQKSFVFVYWILDPHQPYEPVPEYKSRIAVDSLKLSRPPSHFERRSFDVKGLTTYDRDYAKALYLAEVESVDERVGSILKVLTHKGLLNNTFIVFTSDHGEQFGEHGLYGHGGFGRNCHYYEGLLRVPLIISGPGITKGKRIKTNVSLIDLMPTLKELLEIEYEDGMQGVSRVPVMFDKPGENGPLYFDDVQEHEQLDALLDGVFKLICREDGTHELYDVARDSGELDNIASDHPQKVQSMYAEILKIRDLNKEKMKRNIAAISQETHQLSEKDRERITKQLKSLGYID